MSFNIRNSRPLIPREQTYLLDRKLVTIHSEDRDFSQWPRSNNFSITLPAVMENVESMRLVQCNLPTSYHTFSNDYQNTKLSFSVDISGQKPFTITIQDGFYCPEELANEIQERMNSAITDYYITTNNHTIYQHMKVKYDSVGQRYWFGNSENSFKLEFATRETYELKNCEQPNMWDKYTNWGLPAYLGFDRIQYESISTSNPIKFAYLGQNSIWINPTNANKPAQYFQAPLPPYLLGERCIYMEIKKYNSYNELSPYSQRTNETINDYNGIINSAFAKIPVTSQPLGELFDSRNGFLTNVKVFDIPEEKIAKLEFKFRYHDGRLVEFGNIPFNFTIEFNQLRNEIGRVYNVRIPNAYIL